MKFATVSAVGASFAQHYCVNFGSSDPGSFHVLCGIESAGDAGAKFYLTGRNAADGQANPKAPEAPGMRHTVGWSFITFTWPLIWVHNIDAGSIGTTAISRWQGDDLSLYLVRNGLTTPQSPPITQPPVPDKNSGLFIHTGFGYDDFELSVPSGAHVVRVKFTKEQGYGNRMIPEGTWVDGTFEWTTEAFVVAKQNGKATVTSGGSASERAFLQGVLDKASSEGIYQLAAP